MNLTQKQFSLTGVSLKNQLPISSFKTKIVKLPKMAKIGQEVAVHPVSSLGAADVSNSTDLTNMLIGISLAAIVGANYAP